MAVKTAVEEGETCGWQGLCLDGESSEGLLHNTTKPSETETLHSPTVDVHILGIQQTILSRAQSAAEEDDGEKINNTKSNQVQERVRVLVR